MNAAPLGDVEAYISAGGTFRPASDALYIAEDNPERAGEFVNTLRATAIQTAERPYSFPAREELAPGLRAARHGRYLILFQAVADEIHIVRVLHGARDLTRLFGA